MYKFRFESVLRYRDRLEKAHMLEMSQLQCSLNEEEGRLSLAIDEVRNILAHIASAENEGICANEVSMYRTFLGSARSRMAEQERRIVDIQKAIEDKRLQLIEASKEKKALDKLKKKNSKKIIVELRKKERKEMDEVASKMYREV